MSGIRALLGTIAVGAAGFAAFNTAAVALYHIPSESMVPTLEVGDRLSVSKFAYGWSRHSLVFGSALPEAIKGRFLGASPARGDVVVFAHPLTAVTMIKRVIGLPGDRIEIRSGRIFLNGALVERRLEGAYRVREHGGGVVSIRRFTELLPGSSSYTIAYIVDQPNARDMREIVVPAGQYFMLGDNRDNSADSRFQEMGLVPADNLIGRADAIIFSLKTCIQEPGVACAPRRHLTRIR